MDKATDVVMAGFGRDEELEADRKGIVIANTVGYNPNGLKDFLTTLADRNKASTEKQGLFASHPEMKERFVKLDDTIKTSKLTATATVEAATSSTSPTSRWRSPELRPSRRARPALPAAARQDRRDREDGDKGDAKPEEPKKKRGFGLGKLIAPSSGGEKQASETTGSSAARASTPNATPRAAAIRTGAGP